MRSGRPLACLAAVQLLLGGCSGAPSTSDPTRPFAALPTPDAAGPQEVWVFDPNQQTKTSIWYLEVGGEPLTVTLTTDAAASHFSATATSDDGAMQRHRRGHLGRRHRRARFPARHRQHVAMGPRARGRGRDDGTRQLPRQRRHRARERRSVRRARHRLERLLLLARYRAAGLRPLRRRPLGAPPARPLDSGAIVGRFKVYADDATGVAAEEVEYDVDVQHWDGHALTFVRSSPSWTQTFVASVDGRTLAGSMSSSMSATPVWLGGTRVELLA